MSIKILSAELGFVATNAYIVGDEASKQAIVIDPVDDAPRLQQMAADAGWQIGLIVATHAHFDHILASKALKELTGAPFVIHRAAEPWLQALPHQGQRFGLGQFPSAAEPDRWLGDAPETVTLGGITLETLYTPGHAPDHIAYFLRDAKVLFSGDCIFEMGIGRVDLPGGDYQQLMTTITETILPLGDDVRLLTGHGGQTTVGRERQSNPFILDYLGK